MLNERFTKILIWLGILILVLSIILFAWNSSLFLLNDEADTSKLGQFGDLIGGLVGSIWAVAGVILFYLALREQRRDIQINQEALSTQIEEFKGQKIEMAETRKEHKRQTANLKATAKLNAMGILVDHYSKETEFYRGRNEDLYQNSKSNRNKYIKKIEQILNGKEFQN